MTQSSHVWQRLRLWRPSFGQVAAVMSLLGAAIFVFVAGAAVMHYGVGPSDFLRKAFSGAETWVVSGNPPMPPSAGLPLTKLNVTRPDAAYVGLTLYTTNQSQEATLIDMGGRVVHRWKMPSARPWPKALNVRDPMPGEPLHWEKCWLYPNGDVLVICCSEKSSPYGYGVAKLDKDSTLLWGYSCNAHHDVTVAEDGRIYVVTDQGGVPAPAGLDSIPSRYNADYVVILSPEGKELARIPILEAFQGTPYLQTLVSGNESTPSAPFPPAGATGGGPAGPPPGVNPPPGAMPPGGLPFPPPGGPPVPNMPTGPSGPNTPIGPPPPDPLDVLHVNSVMVLSKALAPKFPMFKPGQILISLRTPSAVAVLDPETRSVVWAARGVWRYQHDARFLDSGKLMIFDNFGSARGARVLEYDPATQGMAWSYGGDKDSAFTTAFRGGNQRLPNGNTLVIDAEGLKILEVTADKEIAWNWSCPETAAPQPSGGKSESLNLTGARRYGPAELTFLKGASDVRAD